jgi:hypothetical protein
MGLKSIKNSFRHPEKKSYSFVSKHPKMSTGITSESDYEKNLFLDDRLS